MSNKKPLVLHSGNLSELPSGFGLTAEQVQFLFGNISSLSFSFSGTTPSQMIDLWPASTYRSAEYKILATDGTVFQKTTVDVLHDGSNIIMGEYASISTGIDLLIFDADMSLNNIRFLATPQVPSVRVKVLRTLTLI